MPMYEFKCEDCGYHFETLVFSSSEKVSCPKCKSTHLKRLISSFSVSGGKSSSSASEDSCPTCTTGTCPICR